MCKASWAVQPVWDFQFSKKDLKMRRDWQRVWQEQETNRLLAFYLTCQQNDGMHQNVIVKHNHCWKYLKSPIYVSVFSWFQTCSTKYQNVKIDLNLLPHPSLLSANVQFYYEFKFKFTVCSYKNSFYFHLAQQKNSKKKVKKNINWNELNLCVNNQTDKPFR